MAETSKTAFQYAWRGSGQKWDAVPLQIIGGAIGGYAFLHWGVKLPQEILDNPALSGLIGIAIGALTGVIAVFLLRLCWWPFHRRLEPFGGLVSFLSLRLGKHMWPIILIATGFILFLLLSGGGLVWLLVQTLNGERIAVDVPRPEPHATISLATPAPELKYRQGEVNDLIVALQKLSPILKKMSATTGDLANQAISSDFRTPGLSWVDGNTGDPAWVSHLLQGRRVQMTEYEKLLSDTQKNVEEIFSLIPEDIRQHYAHFVKSAESSPALKSILRRYIAATNLKTADLAYREVIAALNEALAAQLDSYKSQADIAVSAVEPTIVDLRKKLN